MIIGHKLFVSLLIVWIMFTLLDAIPSSKWIIAVTHTTSAVSVNATNIPAYDTSGFSEYSRAWLGNSEYFSYTSVNGTDFLGVTRGVAYGSMSTYPQAWSMNTRAEIDASNFFDAILDVNLAEVQSTVGSVGALLGISWGSLGLVFKALAWNYSWMTGPLFLIRIFLIVVFSLPFVISIGVVMTQALRNLLPI